LELTAEPEADGYRFSRNENSRRADRGAPPHRLRHGDDPDAPTDSDSDSDSNFNIRRDGDNPAQRYAFPDDQPLRLGIDDARSVGIYHSDRHGIG
jgi:hypothetical protein